MKLGIYQCIAAGRSPEARLAVLEQHLEGQELDLLVCPELFLSGYNVGRDIDRLAEPPDGPFGRKMAALAQKYRCAIAYGYPERADTGLYNSAALYDSGGLLLATHRKQLPSPGSFEEQAFGRGDGVTFADIRGWRVAMIICYEVEFPETVRQAAQGGADLVLVPTALGADWGVVAQKILPARAFENGVWLAYADHAGAENGARYYGGSRIVAPDGAAAAVAGQDEVLIIAEIDRDKVRMMQARLPYLRDCGML
ncbi:carbon-nitrogen hydrolase family protein [Roseovarius sp. CAU 1744]|uniref:carbon-nitrogen hydrolase family protein n=1 Tax=Roseovarius sp. CAU 1744 TaxID=3140368 RepID=UPI00325BE6DA